MSTGVVPCHLQRHLRPSLTYLALLTHNPHNKPRPPTSPNHPPQQPMGTTQAMKRPVARRRSGKRTRNGDTQMSKGTGRGTRGSHTPGHKGQKGSRLLMQQRRRNPSSDKTTQRRPRRQSTKRGRRKPRKRNIKSSQLGLAMVTVMRTVSVTMGTRRRRKRVSRRASRGLRPQSRLFCVLCFGVYFVIPCLRSYRCLRSRHNHTQCTVMRLLLHQYFMTHVQYVRTHTCKCNEKRQCLLMASARCRTFVTPTMQSTQYAHTHTYTYTHTNARAHMDTGLTLLYTHTGLKHTGHTHSFTGVAYPAPKDHQS